MRICLISAATVTEYGELARNKSIRDVAEHPPLGILTLAAILREQLVPPSVIDLNRLYYEYLGAEKLENQVDFCSWACSRIPGEFDVIGLSTICSSYPLTIRFADQIKRAYPRTTIILGGPQASAVDVATLEAFASIDLIVRGEADQTLVEVLRTGIKSPALALIPGITFRSGRSIIRNPEAPVVTDLDSLPFPAFDLLPGIEPPFYFPLELGRGCPFSCTFCSTNDFFRRRFRLKSPEALLAQIARVRRDYNVKRFDLVHDMFTVDRKRVIAFCQALLDAREEIQWGCSARTDCIDDELIELMYRAGCRSLFFGIETGSQRLQRVIDKGLDLEQAAERIKTCSSAGINTTVSLITGFPEENEEDMWQTISFLMDSVRHELVEPQLHILAPLAGTPIYARFRNQLLLDEVYSDISYQAWEQGALDRQLVASFPAVFSSFYGVPAPNLDRSRLKRLRGFVLHLLGPFRWVAIAIHQSRGGIRRFFERWEEAFPSLARSSQSWTRYYASAEFGRDIACFARAHYFHGEQSDASLETLLQFAEGISADTLEKYPECTPVQTSETPDGASPHNIIPILQEEVRMLNLETDICAIFKDLRRGEGLRAPARRRLTIASRAGKSSGTDILELTPVSASFLRLCDGRTLDRVTDELDLDVDLINAMGRQEIGAFIFNALRNQRLVSWRYRSS